MSENTQARLGKLVTEPKHRDAVHIAVAPIVAARRLNPGQHVGLTKEGKATTNAKWIGVVDPFLGGSVVAGETFWLFLYPNTITTLRHEWAHPAFPQDQPVIAAVEADGVKAARQEIERIAAEMGYDGYTGGEDGDQMTYARLMSAADEWLNYGGYHTQFGGTDWQESFPSERFWMLYAVVTGKAVPDDKNMNFFSCSC